MSALPGEDLVRKGLTDLRAGEETVESLLVEIGAPRLRELGLDVPEGGDEPNLRLYRRVGAERPGDTHAAYNAPIAQLVSFENALAARRRRERR